MRHGFGQRNFANELCDEIRTHGLVDQHLEETVRHRLTLVLVDPDRAVGVCRVEGVRHFVFPLRRVCQRSDRNKHLEHRFGMKLKKFAGADVNARIGRDVKAVAADIDVALTLGH